ncbi:hypothetical protein KCP69_21195 [Salmonella enterica subsp. enterica]|nr:hypothetical protein KCP69_21195 [Salmonella enterica subsp. enterica]
MVLSRAYKFAEQSQLCSRQRNENYASIIERGLIKEVDQRPLPEAAALASIVTETVTSTPLAFAWPMRHHF